MARVTVYATPFCAYCVGAKRYLRRRGIPFDEVRINLMRPGARDRIQAASGGGRTFP
ncbi:MAG: glutaredoxin family protein, partial [Miltoncostaeaceae bacterium]